MSVFPEETLIGLLREVRATEIGNDLHGEFLKIRIDAVLDLYDCRKAEEDVELSGTGEIPVFLRDQAG